MFRLRWAARATSRSWPTRPQVLVGHQVKLTPVLDAGSTCSLNYTSWEWSCPQNPNQWHSAYITGHYGDHVSVDVCETLIGTKTYRCTANYGFQQTATAEITVTILPPEKITPVNGAQHGFPGMSEEIYFNFTRDGQSIGGCGVAAIFQERITYDQDVDKSGWQPSTQGWIPAEGQPPSSTFYWRQNEGRGFDLKQVYWPGTFGSYATVPEGGLLGPSVIQEVRLGLTTVCGEVEWHGSTGGWMVDMRKDGNGAFTTDFKLMPDPPASRQPTHELELVY